jgi:hypothetical protein
VAESSPDLEGNWFVEWRDCPEPGQTGQGALTLAKPWEIEPEWTESGARRWVHTRQDDAEWTATGWCGEGFVQGHPRVAAEVSPAGRVTMESCFLLGYWGGESVVQQAGDNEMRGRWTYEGEEGIATWRRAIPKITRVKFISDVEDEVSYGARPGRVQDTFHSFWWGPTNDMTGNRPSFWIEVYGDNLWGHHTVDLGGELDLQPCAFSYIEDEDAVGLPDKAVGLKVEVLIWPAFRPGRKTLFVDGMEIPFDLIVEGYEGPEQPELRFVREEDGGFVPIGDKLEFYGDPLYLESRYESEQDGDTRPGHVSWYSEDGEQLGTLSLTLTRTAEEPLLYRSEVFYVMPPPIPKGLYGAPREAETQAPADEMGEP